jgi:hypothetical protein
VIGLGALVDPRILDLDEIADMGALADAGAGAQPGKGPMIAPFSTTVAFRYG